MNHNTLKLLQHLSLDLKVAKTKMRIQEFIDMYGVENVYVSFSGGKDSTVLLNIARQVNKDIQAIYCDTPMEFPEIRKFAKSIENVSVVRATMPLREYFDKYGYPVESKRISDRIYRVRNTKSLKEYNRYMNNVNPDGTPCKFGISEKHKHYVKCDFKISAKCCDVYKKRPMKAIKKRPIIGTLAVESSQRKMQYIKNGCNVFGEKGYSTPLGFWTEQDILKYIYVNDIKISDVYGQVTCENGVYKTTGESRTGCMFCTFGVRKDKERFIRLKKTHPKLHDYCVNKLGFKEVLEYMEVKYEI